MDCSNHLGLSRRCCLWGLQAAAATPAAVAAATLLAEYAAMLHCYARLRQALAGARAAAAAGEAGPGVDAMQEEMQEENSEPRSRGSGGGSGEHEAAAAVVAAAAALELTAEVASTRNAETGMLAALLSPRPLRMVSQLFHHRTRGRGLSAVDVMCCRRRPSR